MTNSITTPKHKYQFKFINFEKAYLLLIQRLEILRQNPEDQMVQIAVIQTFEFTFELAWKLLKSYMEYKGLVVDNFARDIIKSAYQNHLIADGKVWLNALEDSNKTSHTYNDNFARQMATRVIHDYQPAFDQIYRTIRSDYDQN